MDVILVSNKPCWPSSASPTGYASDGGAPLQIAETSELFDSTRVLIACDKNRDRSGEMVLTGKNLTVAPLLAQPRWTPAALLRLPAWVLRNLRILARETRRADAVLTSLPGKVGVAAILVALLLRKPLRVIFTMNWREPRNWRERLERRFLEALARGRNVVLVLGSDPAMPSERNERIKWLFSTTLSERELETMGATRVLPTSGRIRIATVARQEPEKGTHILIEAVARLREQLPGVSLDVVGDGSALAECKRLAKALGVEDRVTFHGRVDHARVMEVLEEAHLFCLPSQSESFSQAVHEALAHGLPVVTTFALPWFAERGCAVVAHRNGDALADALASCLSSPAQYRRMSQAALETARALSLESWREEMGRILENAWGPLSAGEHDGRSPASSRTPAGSPAPVELTVERRKNV